MPAPIQPVLGKTVEPVVIRDRAIPALPAVRPDLPTRGTSDERATQGKHSHRTAAESNGSPEAINRAQLEEALTLLSKAADLANKGIRFKVHEPTDRLMVQVVHRETNEVIREIPPERVLDLAAKMQEFLGLLFDERI